MRKEQTYSKIYRIIDVKDLKNMTKLGNSCNDIE